MAACDEPEEEVDDGLKDSLPCRFYISKTNSYLEMMMRGVFE